MLFRKHYYRSAPRASRKNRVRRIQCLSRYRIAMPRPGVRFDFLLRELGREPGVQLVYHWAAIKLVEAQILPSLWSVIHESLLSSREPTSS